MRIAHISDIHCNEGSDFNSKVFNKAVPLLNKYEADIVFVSGDITTWGLLSEYEMAEKLLEEITGKKVFIPGNHDERNLGFKLFPEFFGKTDFIHTFKDFNLVGLASSEPDKDDGRLGRSRHLLIKEAASKNNKLTFVGLHHHLIPVPNSGREHNIIEDAGETLDIVLRNEIPLVLMGHRHVPFAVKIHKTLFLNAGTFSCVRTRGRYSNTFNIIDINDNILNAKVVDIADKSEKEMIKFNINDGSCKNNYFRD